MQRRYVTRLVIANRSHNSTKDVVVSLLDGGVHESKLRKAGIEVHSLGLNGFARLPAALIRLVLLMRRIRPRLVMTWLYHADLIGLLAAMLSGTGAKRVIWNVRCSNIDFRNYAFTTLWIVRILTWLSPLPKLVSVNSRTGRHVHEALGYRPRDWVLMPNGVDLSQYRPDGRDRVQVRAELGLDATKFAVGMIARATRRRIMSHFLRPPK